MNDRKSFYRLFYLWAIAPRQFFVQILTRFKGKRNNIQILYLCLSFLFPLLGGTLIFTFLARFAVIDIADKIVPQSLIWLALVILSFLLNFSTLLLIPGFSIKYQMYKLGNGTLRIFHRLNVLRNNLFQIPAIVVLIIVNITSFRQTWKIYTLGIYLAVIIIMIFFWVTIFQVSSLPSIRLQLDGENLPKRIIPFYQFGFKAIWSTVFFTAFCILLNYGLELWLGASDMSLWAKLAMLILHGN